MINADTASTVRYMDRVGASIAKVQDLGNTSGVDGDTFVLQASTRF
jgi:hypothetical protein